MAGRPRNRSVLSVWCSKYAEYDGSLLAYILEGRANTVPFLKTMLTIIQLCQAAESFVYNPFPQLHGMVRAISSVIARLEINFFSVVANFCYQVQDLR